MGRAHRRPRYPLPWRTVASIAWDALLVRDGVPRRSFRADACAFVARLRPPLHVYGAEHVPQRGPVLLTINHFARPGFQAYWLALAVSATVPVDVYWSMTAAWTYPDWLRAHTLTPATRWFFRRLARLYAFTTVPPMPPHPRDTVARAAAVRRVLAYARHTPRPVVALAPEGADASGGRLAVPPSGVGRFALHLAARGLIVAPVGGYEREGVFCLRFGPPYALAVPAGLSAAARDARASRIVMRHIAALLPVELRGAYAEPEEDDR
jgi:hypothetical protein